MTRSLHFTVGSDAQDVHGVSLFNEMTNRHSLLRVFRTEYEAQAFALGYSLASGVPIAGEVAK